MAELFEITKGAKVRYIDELPFQDELNDMESFIRENPKVIGESIEIFAEQVDTGTSVKIDLLALDKTAGTAQIAIIELKNDIAEQPVLLQTLRYASWVKNNPDSIKYLLEKKRLTIQDVDFNPKIIIIAPQIDPALLEVSQYTTTFEFDFVELKRFGTKDNCYLITDHKTLPQPPQMGVRSLSEWNWENYESELGISTERIEIGKSLFNKIQAICQKKQWSLTPRFNRYYITFKFGARNVVLISFSGGENDKCDLGFKLGQPPKRLHLIDPYLNSRGKFWDNSGEYYVGTDIPNFDIETYIPFMEAAYRNVTKE
jgi:hypothetical protein